MNAVAIDVGTGGIHTALYRSDGTMMANRYYRLDYTGDRSGTILEFDAEDLVTLVLNSINEVMKQTPSVTGKNIVIGITSQRHGCVFLDEKMTPLLSVPNLDGRVDQETIESFSIEASEIYDLTGRLPLDIFPALRLSWICRSNPELFSHIHSFLMINEYLAYRLTGIPLAEKTSASETLLFDIVSCRWSDRLKKIFGVEKLQMWPVVEPGTIVGELLPDIAGRLSISNKTCVSLGAGDTQCAAIGSGAYCEGDIVAVNGSTTPVVAVSEKLLFDPRKQTWTDHYSGKNFLLESNVGKSGIMLRDLLGKTSDGRLQEVDIRSLTDAANLKLYGKLVPSPWKPISFQGTANSLHFTADPAKIIGLIPYLIVENIAFAITARVRELERIMQRDAGRIFLTGGGSRSKLLSHIVSELLGQQRVLLTEVLDTTAKGMAMLAISSVQSVPLQETFSCMDSVYEHAVELKRDQNYFGISDMIHDRYDRWRELYNGVDRFSGN